jgi:hypothetical protein
MESDGLIQKNSLKNHLGQILYSRNFLKNLTSPARKYIIQSLLDSKQEIIVGPSKEHTFENAYFLLVSLYAVNRGRASNEMPYGMLSLADTMKILPKWNDQELSYICLRDQPYLKLKMSVMQRVQQTGNCFMFAVAMLQHYLIAKFNSFEESPPILDVRKFLVENASDSMFESYLLNHGGQFRRFMQVTFQRVSCH